MPGGALAEEKGVRAVGRKGREERLRESGPDAQEVSEGGMEKSVTDSAHVGTAMEVLTCSFHYTC